MSELNDLLEVHAERLDRIARFIAAFRGLDHWQTLTQMLKAIHDLDIDWFKRHDIVSYEIIAYQNMPKTNYYKGMLIGSLIAWHEFIVGPEGVE